MYVSRQLLEDLEKQYLAPYATLNSASLGRRHAEPKHRFRTEFQRDRERIVHSRSFRRLEYKTQVFLNGTGDHYRTRLTHTIEVASIARSVARTLRLSEDLAEAIALAHDLGHPPFGHSGEEALDRLMREHGGFDHNQQSLRVVELLEQRYPQFSGLNLTYEVLEGLRKHHPPHLETGRTSPSLEAQLADVADDLTYCTHDIDDALEAGLIAERDLRDIELWQHAAATVRGAHPHLERARFRSFTVRTLIDLQVERLLHGSAEQLERRGIATAADVLRQPYDQPLVCFAAADAGRNAALRAFLYERVYYSQRVAEANRRAVERIAGLFEFYLAHPQRMGRQAQRSAAQEGLERAVCDYLAGMTDRYANEEFNRWLAT